MFSQVLKFVRSVLKVVFKLLKRHNQEITLDDHIQIFKQSALEKVGKPTPEPEPEPKKRTKTVLWLTDWLELASRSLRSWTGGT